MFYIPCAWLSRVWQRRINIRTSSFLYHFISSRETNMNFGDSFLVKNFTVSTKLLCPLREENEERHKQRARLNETNSVNELANTLSFAFVSLLYEQK